MNIFKLIREIREEERERKAVLKILEDAKICGLREADYLNALDLIKNYEQAIALEVIAVQLYEYTIPINEALLNEIVVVGEKMGCAPKNWLYLRELLG